MKTTGCEIRKYKKLKITKLPAGRFGDHVYNSMDDWVVTIKSWSFDMRLAITIHITPLYCIVKLTWVIGKSVAFYNWLNKAISFKAILELLISNKLGYYWNDLQFNTLKPRQSGHHFQDDISKCIFVSENVWISLKISLRFVPNVPTNNIPALVHIMAWHRPGDKPLSEPMVVGLLTHICVAQPQLRLILLPQ